MRIIVKMYTALLLVAMSAAPMLLTAETVKLEVEGLLMPTSPAELSEGLEQALAVKVLRVDVRGTPNGWPVVHIEYEAGVVTPMAIEAAIATIENAAGNKYKVHKGPPQVRVPLLLEEEAAIVLLGQGKTRVLPLKNPLAATKASIASGQQVYVTRCAKCHGQSGAGDGPAALSFTTPVAVLNSWSDADADGEAYLYAVITNGRTDMPPWGLVLSEAERWHVINYIKTLN